MAGSIDTTAVRVRRNASSIHARTLPRMRMRPLRTPMATSHGVIAATKSSSAMPAASIRLATRGAIRPWAAQSQACVSRTKGSVAGIPAHPLGRREELVVGSEVQNRPLHAPDSAVGTVFGLTYGNELDERLAALGDDEGLARGRDAIHQLEAGGLELPGGDFHMTMITGHRRVGHGRGRGVTDEAAEPSANPTAGETSRGVSDS